MQNQGEKDKNERIEIEFHTEMRDENFIFIATQFLPIKIRPRRNDSLLSGMQCPPEFKPAGLKRSQVLVKSGIQKMFRSVEFVHFVGCRIPRLLWKLVLAQRFRQIPISLKLPPKCCNRKVARATWPGQLRISVGLVTLGVVAIVKVSVGHKENMELA